MLATAGDSPDWLLGPLRFAGADAARGPLAGPLFYAGLWLALLLYVAVLLRASDISPRLALAAIGALHALFFLAPPLLSQDVFSYIAYARIGAEHGMNPYATAPLGIASDEVFPFAGSKHAASVYGPVFTILTYPLASLGVAGALWVLKATTALASLGIVASVWKAAEHLGRSPVPAALAVGLSPLVLVHVVSAAHNEALVVLVTTVGVAAFACGRERIGVATTAAATGIKASAGLVTPFFVLAARGRGGSGASASEGPPGEGSPGRSGSPSRLRAIAGALAAAAATAAAIALTAVIAFGVDSLDALSLIGSNQGRTSRFSLPYKTAQLLGALLPGDRLDFREAVRIVYALAFAAIASWLLVRTWRGGDPIAMAGWAILAVLLASAWLVPWYALWVLPLAALAPDQRLLAATTALSAWMLAITVPL